MTMKMKNLGIVISGHVWQHLFNGQCAPSRVYFRTTFTTGRTEAQRLLTPLAEYFSRLLSLYGLVKMKRHAKGLSLEWQAFLHP
jgi:hypothetical protein